jgi:HTH-type transcriptional regulator, sugar sensing transcriptional regulator
MIEELERLGLTNGEARVYVALLKHESSTVGPIVQESRVAYSKIYEVLQRLAEKGLASFIVKNKTRYYQAASPHSLNDYMKRKEEELIQNKELLKKLTPSLTQLQTNTTQESTQIFVGQKGIIAAYDIMLSKAKKHGVMKYFMSSKHLPSKEVIKFFIERPQFDELAKKYYADKKITWQGIVDKDSDTSHVQKYMKIKKTNEPLPGTVDISDEHILITSWSNNPIGILIESRQIANIYQEYFDKMWKRM